MLNINILNAKYKYFKYNLYAYFLGAPLIFA